ncbi:hypothetical protein ACFXPY_46005 [Streptomyces sp. NPDC059153]|uniref:hypothetical protein n=1 Tax=Streptomyces sp. NPDC059153 TaxID=3346743 RepID=UPI0036ABA811
MEASGYAHQSDAWAVEAQAAAAARRHAQEATRAANAAVALARRSATVAGQARDAATSAAKHARASAKAANDAADHAGDAATAATESRAHANVAQEAADEASVAIEKEKTVTVLAREAEAAELLARTNAGIERVKDLKEEEQARRKAQAEAAQRGNDCAAKARLLAVEAAQPGAVEQVVADKGRKLAVLVMRDGGPWSRSAAEAAVASAGVFYDDAGHLACIALAAATGPQSTLAGVSLAGRDPEQMEQWLLEDYAAEHGGTVLFTLDGSFALTDLGLLIRTQRIGDTRLARPLIVIEDWFESTYYRDHLPLERPQPQNEYRRGSGA